MQETKEMGVKLTATGFWLTENLVGLSADGVLEDLVVEKEEKLAPVRLIGSLKKCNVKFEKNNKNKNFSDTEVVMKRILRLRQRKCKNKSK